MNFHDILFFYKPNEFFEEALNNNDD